jgi:hypothetical protein
MKRLRTLPFWAAYAGGGRVLPGGVVVVREEAVTP